MEKDNYKDNVLRTCYHNKINGCSSLDFVFDDITDDIGCILDELMDDCLIIKCENNQYYITKKGVIFVLTTSFCVPGKPICMM